MRRTPTLVFAVVPLRADPQSLELYSSNSVFAQTPWQKVRVGNIVRVYCDEAFPADSLLLNTGTREDCLVETSVTDGGRDFQRSASLSES